MKPRLLHEATPTNYAPMCKAYTVQMCIPSLKECHTIIISLEGTMS